MLEKNKIGGFSFVETILSISIFLVTILVLIAILEPVLLSLDEVEESDEISSVVESLNSFLQSNSSLSIDSSNFDLIYETVKSGGYATIYIYRSFISENSSNVQLSIGFSRREKTTTVQMNRNARIYNFKDAAGPIYRAILTVAPHMPDGLYTDRGRSANPRYYLNSNRSKFGNNYLPLEISLYSNELDPEYIDKVKLKEIIKKKPIVNYFTVINR